MCNSDLSPLQYFSAYPKVFAKKEEMIRHSKWHQKMDEAFKYGFRRVTPMDDCSEQFPTCPHNKKQTHYHCIHTDTCDKAHFEFGAHLKKRPHSLPLFYPSC